MAAAILCSPSEMSHSEHSLEVLSFIMLTGVLSTLLIPETKQRSLEDLSNEIQESFITGVIERGAPLYP